MAVHLREMIKAVTTARANGARAHSAVRTEWDVAGKCRSPVTVEMWSRPDAGSTGRLDKKAQIMAKAISMHWPGAQVISITKPQKAGQLKHVTVRPGSANPLGLTLHVRCRKCEACLLQRELLWRSRVKQELRYGTRNWFGTLTLDPTEQALARNRAIARTRKQGTVFEALEESEQFAAVVRQINPLITRWLKRVRKECGGRIRYCLVVEAHKSGLPHFHLVVHERSPEKPVRKRTLQAQWKHGFSSFKLVEDEQKHAHYVCKYLGKSSLARVRASGHYGDGLIHNVSVSKKRLTSPDQTTQPATEEPVAVLVTGNGDIADE